MAGFDASAVVKPLDWDFSGIVPNGGKGTVPEPSDKAIETALREMAQASAKMLKSLGFEREPDMTEERIMQVLAAFPDDFEAQSFARLSQEMIKIFAKLCSGQPSATQLKALPFRARQLFYLWLMKELRPEADGGATTRPPLQLVRPA